MDPNATLREILDVAKRLRDNPADLGEISTLAENIMDLDDWITEREGFLPDRWNHSEPDVDQDHAVVAEDGVVAYFYDPQHIQFIANMSAGAGMADHLMVYHGRGGWVGPAISVRDLQDALSHTKVPCRWESLGKGWVVWPATRGEQPTYPGGE